MTDQQKRIAIAECMGWKWYRFQNARQGSRGLNWYDSWRVALLREKPKGFRIRNVSVLKNPPSIHEEPKLPYFFDYLNLDKVLEEMDRF